MNNFYDILSMYNVHIYYLLKLEDSLKNMATFIIYESCQVLEIYNCLYNYSVPINTKVVSLNLQQYNRNIVQSGV
jgi:hypothetical protein